MTFSSLSIPLDTSTQEDQATKTYFLKVFFIGMLLPLSFSPFHFPGMAFLSLALFYQTLLRSKRKHFFMLGFNYGLGFFTVGISWIAVSIHVYGHLHLLLTLLITCLFIIYLSLYLACLTGLFGLLCKNIKSPFTNIILFASCWTLSEYLRSTLLTGFPWLLIGTGQMDSPLQHLLPLIGTFGTSFMSCIAAGYLGQYFNESKQKLWLFLLIGLLTSPLLLRSVSWTIPAAPPLSVGSIQANLSMRDKWNEALFWHLIDHYQTEMSRLLKKKDLIILPESAIPLPSSFVSDLLHRFDDEAKEHHRGLLLGIPYIDEADPSLFYNTLLGLGEAQGQYQKQHLVPFGEYVPSFFSIAQHWLNLPPNMTSGQKHQALLTLRSHSFASLICYELAYPSLLRAQLPQAEWIISISDDGWFGHSLALFQHLQMAQALSKQTGRYQVMSNNNGLSSLINEKGQILHSLPAFSPGILEGKLIPYQGNTPWTYWGDKPVLLVIAIYLLRAATIRKRKS